MKKSLIGLLIGLIICMILVAFANESPVHVLKVMLNSALGSPDDFALTLFYSTSLIFTGLAVAIAFKAGLFNIGAEGQLTVAGLSIIFFSPYLNRLPGELGLLLLLLLSFAGGALLAAISSWIKVYRGGHEVVATMMLNFLSASAATYLIVGPLHNPSSQNPESFPIAQGLMFRNYDPFSRVFPNSPVNFSLVLAILFCISTWWILKKTLIGYQIKATGFNDLASRFHGINTNKVKMLVMMFSGALASGAAINEILGSSGKFKIGFSADFGFVGIAVALLARNHPLAIIPSALLFGILQKGTGDLDLETQNITRDFSRIIQAVIILSVTIVGALDWSKIFSSFQTRFKKAEKNGKS